MTPRSKWVVLGKILGEWGISGQVKCVSFNPESELFPQLKKIFVGRNGEYREFSVLHVKHHTKYWLLHFQGYENPESARGLRGMELALPREDLPKLKAGELYLTDLEGFQVKGPRDEKLGSVVRFQRVGDSEVMVIIGDAKNETWVPYRSVFVQSTSLEEGVIQLTEAALEFFTINSNDTSI